LKIINEIQGVSMKKVKFLTIGTLVLGLVAIAVGASFLMTGTTATRPQKTFDDYMEDAEIYLDDGDYYKAVVSYESALDAKEQDVDALQGLASVYSRQMNYKKEQEIRQQIAELIPDDLNNQIRLVEIEINLGKLGTAKAMTEELMDAYDSEELRSLYAEMNIDTPIFNIASGAYGDYQLLLLMNTYNNAYVRYTTDGNEPTIDSQLYSDGIVISYPETVIRAKAFGALGYTSEEVRLDFTITKPTEVVSSRSYNSYSDMLYRIGDSILNKPWASDIYNYEMAQIRELYMLGDYNVSSEPMTATFCNGYFNMHERRYTEMGNFNLDFVAYTPFLKTLSVGYQNELDISPLSSLNYLENLSLLNDGITDISPLSGLSTLKKLALGWNSISDVSPLSELSGLESLGLWNNQLSDISGLENLSQLTYLDIAYNEVSQIDCVAQMPNLNELWINNNRITNISSLGNCTKLMVLMQNDNQIDDYSPIEGIAKQLYKSDVNW